MSASLAITIAAYAVVLAVVSIARAALGAATVPAQLAALVVLEIAAVGQALGATIGLAGGYDPGERAVLAAYLVVSVAILPLTWAAAAGDRTRWRGITLSLGLIALAVVSLRSVVLWRA